VEAAQSSAELPARLRSAAVAPKNVGGRRLRSSNGEVQARKSVLVALRNVADRSLRSSNGEVQVRKSARVALRSGAVHHLRLSNTEVQARRVAARSAADRVWRRSPAAAR